MRKQSFLFIAGAVLALASCQTENTDNASDQAYIDSTVNARVEEMRVEMMMQNDSMINALATLRADSIIAAMKGGNTVTTRTNTVRTTTVKGTSGSGAKRTETETIGSGKPKMGESNTGSNTIGSGKPKMGETKKDSKTIGTGKPKMGDDN
jgi:hypothetical protein